MTPFLFFILLALCFYLSIYGTDHVYILDDERYRLLRPWRQLYQTCDQLDNMDIKIYYVCLGATYKRMQASLLSVNIYKAGFLDRATTLSNKRRDKRRRVIQEATKGQEPSLVEQMKVSSSSSSSSRPATTAEDDELVGALPTTAAAILLLELMPGNVNVPLILGVLHSRGRCGDRTRR